MSYYAPGQYKAIIKHVGLSESKDKKTPYVQLIVEPTGMIDVGSGNVSPVDRSFDREIMLWLTESTADRTCEDLRRIGFTGDSFDELVDGPARESLIGQEVQCRCEAQLNKGKEYEKWNLSGSARSAVNNAKLDDHGVRKLNALFGKQLKASKLQQANTPGPAQPVRADAEKFAADINQELAAVQEDDSIPF